MYLIINRITQDLLTISRRISKSEIFPPLQNLSNIKTSLTGNPFDVLSSEKAFRNTRKQNTTNNVDVGIVKAWHGLVNLILFDLRVLLLDVKKFKKKIKNV